MSKVGFITDQTEHVRHVKEGTDEIVRLFAQNPYIVLNFYAKWCPPSIQLTSSLIRNARRAKLFILAVIDADIEKNITVGTLIDVNSFINKLTSFPSVYLFKGNLSKPVFKFVGNNEAKVREMMECISILQGRAPPVLCFK